jgi:hypothetical protein
MPSEKLIAWCKEKGLDPNSDEVGIQLIKEINELAVEILRLSG